MRNTFACICALLGAALISRTALPAQLKPVPPGDVEKIREAAPERPTAEPGISRAGIAEVAKRVRAFRERVADHRTQLEGSGLATDLLVSLGTPVRAAIESWILIEGYVWAKENAKKRVLVFNFCKGFVHGSIPWGAKAIEIMGEKTGAYETVVTDDAEYFRPNRIREFDTIVMNSTTGTLFTDEELRKSFLDFVRSGGGLVGIHAATDCFYDWREYGEMIGGYFNAHPWHEDVGVKIDDPDHPLNAAFGGQGFIVKDEIYQFKAPYSRDRQRVILSLDINRTNMNKNSIRRTDNDFAVSWLRNEGDGRVFYCSLGHRNEIFWNAPVLQHYLDGIQYALGDLPADATPVPLSPRQVDAYMGIYEGTYAKGDDEQKAEAYVVAEGNGRYRAAITRAGVRFDMANAGAAAAGGRMDVRTSKEPGAPRGVNYEYYEGDWNKLPDFDELQPAATGTDPYFDIKVRKRNDHFGLRFKAFVNIPEDGTYLFTTTSDDGSQLFVGEKRVVDNDGLHGMDTRKGKIQLTKGMHPITVTMFEKGGGEGLVVGYTLSVDTVAEGIQFEGTHDGVEYTGTINGDVLTAEGDDGSKYTLTYVERKSPTLGAPPPEGGKALLVYEPGTSPSLDAWQNKKWIASPDGSMQVRGGDQRTVDEFGSMKLHVEFMCPFMPTARGQGRGNSGVYVQDRYEVQVLDSFGLVSKDNDCGGIYKTAVPKVNACLPPLRWQTYDIDFTAAKLGADGAVEAAPRITVRHNGVVIHDDVEIPRPTGGARGQNHPAKAPFRFQDHGNPVKYRNVWVVEE